MAIDYSRLHKHTITIWTRSAPDGYGGYSVNAPQEIMGRWQDGANVDWSVGANGDQINAVAYLTTAVKTGDWLYLGSSAASDPKTVSGARIVKNAYAGGALDGVRRLYRAEM